MSLRLSSFLKLPKIDWKPYATGSGARSSLGKQFVSSWCKKDAPMLGFLFGFNARLGRMHYFLSTIGLAVVMTAVCLVIAGYAIQFTPGGMPLSLGLTATLGDTRRKPDEPSLRRDTASAPATRIARAGARFGRRAF